MKMFTLILMVFASVSSFAAMEISPLKLRPSRGLRVVCITGTDPVGVLEGSSDDVQVSRMSFGGEVRYEVYRDGFLHLTCNNVQIIYR